MAEVDARSGERRSLRDLVTPVATIVVGICASSASGWGSSWVRWLGAVFIVTGLVAAGWMVVRRLRGTVSVPAEPQPGDASTALLVFHALFRSTIGLAFLGTAVAYRDVRGVVVALAVLAVVADSAYDDVLSRRRARQRWPGL